MALRARKPKALEEGFGLGPGVQDAHATEHQRQTDVVDDALAGKEQVLLQHVADAARDARHVLAVQEDVALEGARQTRERMHDGRLTAAGPPHQTHDLTDTEPEGDITDNDVGPCIP